MFIKKNLKRKNNLKGIKLFLLKKTVLATLPKQYNR
jgi:hypothetical protein